MLQNKASEDAGRRLRFSNRGAVNMEYVFGGALALLIVAALALSIHGSLFSKKGSGLVDKIPDDVYFHCDKCQNEFPILRKDLTQQQRAQQNRGLMNADCPKCNEKGSSLEMARCPVPKCKKYYVPESYRDIDALMSMRPGSDICSHCGTDILEWRAEDSAKRRRERQ